MLLQWRPLAERGSNYHVQKTVAAVLGVVLEIEMVRPLAERGSNYHVQKTVAAVLGVVLEIEIVHLLPNSAFACWTEYEVCIKQKFPY